MNVGSQSQPKRTIKVKEFLTDFHAGVSDPELMEKYNLTVTGISRFYDMLQDRGILTEADFSARSAREDEMVPEQTDFESHTGAYCSSCGAEQDPQLGSCQNCNSGQGKTILAPTAHMPEYAATDQSPAQGANQEFAEPFFMDSQEDPLDFSLDSPEEPEDSGMDSIGADNLDFMGSAISCDKCESVMDPVIRVIYERSVGLKSIYISAGIFLLSLITASSLHFFNGYSFARLVVIYTTGLSFFVGSVFLGVGAFMLMARERVYQCASCLKIQPRA